MKLFLGKILLGAVGVFLVLCIINYVYVKIPNQYSIKKCALDEKIERVETLVIGSSVAGYNFNPDFWNVDYAYNAGISAQWPEYDLLLMEMYKDRMKSVKRVVYCMCYQMLWKDDSIPDLIDDETQENMEWKQLQYKTFWGDYCFFNPSCVIKDHYVVTDRIVKYITGKYDVGVDTSGYYTSRKLANRQPNWDRGVAVSAKTQVAKGDEKIRAYQRNAARIQRIAEICRSKNIELHLVLTPVCDGYYEHISKFQYLDFIDFIGKMTEKKQVHFYNYMHSDLFVDDDFSDGTHLNEFGAEKFTKILEKEIYGN